MASGPSPPRRRQRDEVAHALGPAFPCISMLGYGILVDLRRERRASAPRVRRAREAGSGMGEVGGEG